MGNSTLFQKLSAQRQMSILESINRTQVDMGNKPYTLTEWSTEHRDIRNMLLDRDASFSTFLSLVYTLMMNRAEQIKDPYKREYAIDYAESAVRGMLPGKLYTNIGLQDIASVKRMLDPMWSK